MGYLDYAGLQYLWGKLKEKFAPKSHSHDDRYYTEAEVNSKLSGKVDNTEAGANGLINKLESGTAAPVDDDLIITQWANHTTATAANQNKYVRRPMSSIWSYIKTKADSVYQPKGSYAASGHTHDDRYYTEAEVNSKLKAKASSDHTHGLNSSSLTKSVDNATTNSWDMVGGNKDFLLRSLCMQAKAPDWLEDNYAAGIAFGGADTKGVISHAYNAPDIKFAGGNGAAPVWWLRLTGTSGKTYNLNAMPPASHTHTKDQVGLGNVDNTSDASKSVKYAANAGSANTATKATTASTADNATTSNGVKDYNDANKTIKIGFAGAGLTAENLNYIAGYTDNGTKIKDVSKDVLKSWIGLGNYLPLIGGTMSGQITKSTGGSWIGDRDRAAIKSSYAGDSSYGAVAAMATKNGYWTMGNLGGNESLIFNYSTDAKYNAGKNETSQVYLPVQAGTIITSATIGSQSVNYANSAGTANVANSVDWSKVQNKPSSYAPTSHTHDDRYYTESEVNTKLANYQPKGNYAVASHTHNYAGSGSAGGSANSAVKLDSSAGSAIQPVYFKDGKPVATTYALNKTVPADAKFTDTNTWRGIQNNLTSDSTDQSLSAAQGKALKTLVDGKAPISHTHKKSQITDFPSSMPASDVYAWAKAATKPSYTKAEVGLGNVDNTADKNKNVKFATSAGSATNAQCLNNDSQYMRFHWNGQSGQPSWLWGGSDASNMYVYNPSNFSVNYANSAGTTLDAPYTITYEGTYTGTGEYTGSASLPIRHTLSKSYDLVYFIKNLKGRYTPGLINLFSQGNYGKQYVAMNMLPTTFTLITDLSPNIITMYNGGSNTSTSGQWANRNYIRRNGNSIEFYSTYSSNNADYFFNDEYTSYYIFGFNLNHSLFHYDV